MELKIKKYPNGNEYYIFSYEIEKKSKEDNKKKSFDFSIWENLPVGFDFEDLGEFYKHEHCVYSSLARTRKTIKEYLMCNTWDWFGTLTFNPQIIDSFNFSVCSQKVRVFFNNFKRNCPDLKYIAVPEQHKSGAWHFHVLLSNVSDEFFFNTGIVQGDLTIYNFLPYKFGFTNFSRVKDTKKVSTYILKYITKSLCNIPNKQRFYCSKGLKKPDVELINVDVNNVLDMIKYLENENKKIGFLNTYIGEFNSYFVFAVDKL